jgi:hypothetical protein
MDKSKKETMVERQGKFQPRPQQMITIPRLQVKY